MRIDKDGMSFPEMQQFSGLLKKNNSGLNRVE
jgi:hypothetical protein